MASVGKAVHAARPDRRGSLYDFPMKLNGRDLVAALILSVSVLLSPTVVAQTEAEAPTVVYLIRHAEKSTAGPPDDPKNPHLNSEGVRRAGDLVRLLGEAGVTSIFSTDYRRTIETVDPLAKHLTLEIQTYDPRDLSDSAKILKSSPGRHVVSGHSNTTPALVELLGGEPGPPIDEEREYDRLYILVIDSGETTTLRLRYGATSLLPDMTQEE